MDRRSFLKLAGAGVGAVVLDSTAAIPALAKEKRFGFVYDNSKCIGCRACQMACKQWNKLGPAAKDPQRLYEDPTGLEPRVWTLIKLARYEVSDERDYSFIKVGCMHCGDPACVAVCPTGALKRQADGLVTVERNLCNGCGYCTQFCPFHVPQLEVMSPLTGEAKASKCTFCQDRVVDGLRPACVEACPAGALDWGDREAMVAQATERVAALKADYPLANLYGDKILGGLGRMDVLLAPPAAYGLPEDPSFPIGATLWQKVVQPVGGIAFGAVLLGLLGAFFAVRRKVRMEEVE